MKLICPKCQTPILITNVNFKDGFAHCNACEEYFKIANIITDSPFVKHAEKPPLCNITITKTANGTKIQIPVINYNTGQGTSVLMTLFFGFVFVVFFIGGLGSMIERSGSSGFSSLFGAFMLFLFGYWLYKFYSRNIGNIEIHFSKNNILFTRTFFRFTTRKEIPFDDLKDIVEDIEYQGNGYQPIISSALVFGQGKRIKFSSQLVEHERKWLLYELHDIWSEIKYPNLSSKLK